MKIVIKTILFIIVLATVSGCKKENVSDVIVNKKAKWIENTFRSLKSNNYPKVKAISWWHENFDDSFLKVNSCVYKFVYPVE